MCDSPEALLAHAELIVIGNASADAVLILRDRGTHHQVVDLTRGALERRAPED
jgi:hypothetical protein